jgi:hypothetical protein
MIRRSRIALCATELVLVPSSHYHFIKLALIPFSDLEDDISALTESVEAVEILWTLRDKQDSDY